MPTSHRSWLLALALAATFPPAAAAGPDIPPSHGVVYVASDPGSLALRAYPLATSKIPDMVSAFAHAAILMHAAHESSQITSANHYNDVLHELYGELRRRGPAARAPFRALLAHPNTRVRYEAAWYAYEFDRRGALAALDALPAKKGWAYWFDARRRAQFLRSGKYVVPTGGDEDWLMTYLKKNPKFAPARERDPKPGDPTFGDVAAHVRRKGLAAHLGAIREAAKPAYWLRRRLRDDARIPVGSSKVGGLADLPAGAAWPMHMGRRLTFMTQLDLRDFAHVATGRDLPKAGWLSFFFDADAVPGIYGDPDARACAVRYTPPGTPLVRQARPRDLIPALVLGAAQISPVFQWTLPYNPPDVPGLDEAAYAEVRDRAEDPAEGDKRRLPPAHRFLGLTNTIQGEGAEEALLELDSDQYGGRFIWGDGGRIYFWLSDADLRARRFDRVTVSADCH